MKKYLINPVREWLSPSMRYEIGENIGWLREQLSRARFWDWEVANFSMRTDSPFEITYVGRKSQRDLAIALLKASRDDEIGPAGRRHAERRVIVSEVPFPGALCVPSLLSSIVPLGRPIEEISLNYHNQLRRDLQKNRTRYKLQQVSDLAEVERVDREMLRPYANARHGIVADQIELDEVKRMALEYGRLDLLLCGDEVVGCQLGHVITRAGKRFWNTNRCGYPESVFSDPKKLRDSNSINIHLAMEWAIENGYDYYDIGVSLGRPGDGLLEWKRRRGGELCMMNSRGHFYIRLPKAGTSEFLWDSPLFSVKGNKLTLHLGLPQEPSDEEVYNRYREMGFGGLFKVCLHCAKPPEKHMLDKLRSLYLEQKCPPILEIISSTE